MRPSEAKHIGEILANLPDDAISPCLNVGSSTEHFRKVAQPHIDRYIFGPLASRGVEVVHTDLKVAEGVDIAGSIYSSDIIGKIAACRPQLILCCNMFEHVEDRPTLAAALGALVPVNGRLIVTVPYSYPFHPDPIDTYFRPGPEAIAEMFEAFDLETSKVIADVSYGHDLLAEKGVGGTLQHFLRSAAKSVMVWKGWTAWRAHFHRYLWLWKPYQVSCVVLCKRTDLHPHLNGSR
jgi:hypothetical protein